MAVFRLKGSQLKGDQLKLLTVATVHEADVMDTLSTAVDLGDFLPTVEEVLDVLGIAVDAGDFAPLVVDLEDAEPLG